MVSLSDWEGGNYSAAKLGAEEGIRFFLLEKLTQIILGLVFILFLFFIYFIPKIIWRCGTIYKTLFSHMVFQFINVCLSKHWPCLTEMIWGGDNALAKHLAKPQLSVRQDPQSLFSSSVCGNDSSHNWNNSCLDVSAVTLGDFAVCWLISDARCLNSPRILLAFSQ